MPSFTSIVSLAALMALAQGHGVILGAEGIAGSGTSVGFSVNDAVARNCTAISPCQQDTTIIRDAEIDAGTTDNCGRTELAGNIDIATETEDAISTGALTQVAGGTEMTVTIHQVNADGAGPYSCDLLTGANNDNVAQSLTVTDNIPGANGLSQVKEQAFDIKVTMPNNIDCTGGSTGDICTVRCRNNAVAGPFGGCFPVQQTNNANKKRADRKRALRNFPIPQ
ncbi:hypothetical protein F5Y15DRAFT_99769 [Xylariaceae sp. FL0016]|nr:hypothetical protein F5Y15DRAFT_99769 [Xylariaceae sp. FL0016]